MGLLSLCLRRVQEIEQIHEVFPLTLVEQEYSLQTRGPEQDILPTCRRLGIALLAYSPLGRGLLTSTIQSRADLSPEDWRLTAPRFSETNLGENLARAGRLEAIAKRLGLTMPQLALAWLHSKGEDIIPIPGTTNPDRLRQNAKAAKVALSEADLREIDSVECEGLGDRYPGKMGQYEGRL